MDYKDAKLEILPREKAVYLANKFLIPRKQETRAEI